MKKIISVVLVVCLLPQIFGCYSMQEITRQEFENQDEQKEIHITTKKYKYSYSFGVSSYVIVNDSISGRGRLDTKEGFFDPKLVEDFDGKIALSDVQTIKTEKFSIPRTVFAIAFPIALVYAFLYLTDFGKWHLEWGK